MDDISSNQIATQCLPPRKMTLRWVGDDHFTTVSHVEQAAWITQRSVEVGPKPPIVTVVKSAARVGGAQVRAWARPQKNKKHKQTKIDEVIQE